MRWLKARAMLCASKMGAAAIVYSLNKPSSGNCCSLTVVLASGAVMRNNRHWTAIFAAIANLLSAPARTQHDPGVRGGFANAVGEKATCDKRNRQRRIAWALAAIFAL